MDKNKDNQNIIILISIVFVVANLLSNIMASNVLTVNKYISFSCAEFLFPIVYVLSDLVCEVFDFKTAKKIIYYSIVINILSTFLLWLSTFLPTNFSSYKDVFGSAFSGMIGISIASFVAYFVGAYTNAWMMDIFKKKDKEQKFFKRAMLSTIVGEFLDSFIFILFCCVFASKYYFWSNLISLTMTIYLIKITVEFLVFPLTNLLKNKINNRLSRSNDDNILDKGKE